MTALLPSKWWTTVNEASRAGGNFNLLSRGICCFSAIGVKGMSEI